VSNAGPSIGRAARSKVLEEYRIHRAVVFFIFDRDGNVWPLEKPGLGLEINEEFLAKHPPIEGPGYI